MAWFCLLLTHVPALRRQVNPLVQPPRLSAGGGRRCGSPALAQVDVGKFGSQPAQAGAGRREAGRRGAQQYAQMLAEARAKGALAPENHPQLRKLREIARRLIPHTPQWNDRSKAWRWEVNLIGSKQINAFCMPGGKIAFYTGILDQLKLSDDEGAMIMGHEMAHALREHARERIGQDARPPAWACRHRRAAAGPGPAGRRGGQARHPVADAEVQP
jgi:predicted Zn-dependent protease